MPPKPIKIKRASFDGRKRNRLGQVKSLSVFRCPSCDTPKSVTIKLSTAEGKGTATVACAKCIEDRRLNPSTYRGVVYPQTVEFKPKLENKVDVFFRFKEVVAGAIAEQRREATGSKPQNSALSPAVHDDRKALVPASLQQLFREIGDNDEESRKRPREDTDDDGGSETAHSDRSESSSFEYDDELAALFGE